MYENIKNIELIFGVNQNLSLFKSDMMSVESICLSVTKYLANRRRPRLFYDFYFNIRGKLSVIRSYTIHMIV